MYWSNISDSCSSKTWCSVGCFSSNKHNTSTALAAVAMPRIRRIGINTNESVEDKSNIDDPFLVKFYSQHGTKGLGIYVRSEYFSNLEVWDKHVLGKHICKILTSKRFGNYLKCIYFDTTEIAGDLNEMNEWMDTILQLRFKKDDKENILLFMMCPHCENLCTYKHTMDHLSLFLPEFNCCRMCCYGI